MKHDACSCYKDITSVRICDDIVGLRIFCEGVSVVGAVRMNFVAVRTLIVNLDEILLSSPVLKTMVRSCYTSD